MEKQSTAHVSRRNSWHRDLDVDEDPEQFRRPWSNSRAASKFGYFSDINFEKFMSRTAGLDRRLQEINSIYKQVASNSKYGLTPINPKGDGISKNGFEEAQLVGLEKKIRQRRAVRGYYMYFISTLLWFVIYSYAIYLSTVDVFVANAVTRSAIDSLVADLATIGTGTYGYTDSKLGTPNFLQSPDDILTWINQSLIERIFIDPTCGDGICSEMEFQGFGRFGCEADCGAFTNKTAVTIDLTSFMKSRPIINLNKWDISHVIPSVRVDPRFRWNIYSEALGDYVFAGDREEGTVSVDLMDGVYYFELFQTGQSSLNVSAEDMYLNGYIVASSVPEREARTAYKYGDYREFLSTSTAIMDAMYDYCYSADVPRNLDGTEDMECRNFFDKSFGVRALSSYGLSGTITRKNGNQLPIEIVSVPYCGVFPEGSKGLGGMRRVWEGIEIVNKWVTTGEQGGADVNLPILQAASVACPTGIDQSSVNSLFRSLDGDPQNRRRDAPYPTPVKADGGARSAGMRRAGTSAPEVVGRTSNAARSSVGRERRASCDPTRGPTIRIDVGGPPSSLGGPGYDKGVFWHELSVGLDNDCAGVEAGLTFRYAVDGAEPLNCSGGLEYSGPVMLMSTGSSSVQAAACSGTDMVATGLKVLDAIVGGPYLKIRIPSGEGADWTWSNASFQEIQLAACEALAVDPFCAERVSVNVSDGDLTVTMLAATNAEAGSWRQQLILNSSILEDRIPNFGLVRRIDASDLTVTVPVPLYKRHHNGQFCTSHYDCAMVAPPRLNTKVNETTAEDQIWGTGFCAAYGSRASDGRAPSCDYCMIYCMIPSVDSFDGVCPENCGNYFSGEYPACVSAAKLRETYSCSDRHRFELRQFTKEDEPVPDPRKSKMNNLRAITPSNHLIGSVILTQYRIPVGDCSSSATKGMDDFTRFHGIQCAETGSQSSEPFGVDPSFASSSILFDGKHVPEDFYNLTTEVFSSVHAGSPTFTPYGFFPHQWDTTMSMGKNKTHVWGPSEDEFKLYFDGRISHAQALRLLQYIEDGRYLDSSTSHMKVEIITYNAEVKLFGVWTFVFNWHRTGDISWDYGIQIAVINPDDSSSGLHNCISALALFFLGVHILMELMEIYTHVITMKISDYFSSWFNLLDWLNFSIQCIAWSYQFDIKDRVSSFQMDTSSYVLADPLAKFRPFATDPEQEYKLLRLIDQVATIGDSQAQHKKFAGMSIMLFVLKMIVSLDFQPKMGLITRTLARAGSNMAHFLALYFIVFIGYAIVGNIMFGPLYAGMATLTDTCQTLMFMMLAFDPTQFYSQMNHAITHRQGSGIQPGSMEYNIYVWSYMLINSFFLMNIFLAILVSAYSDIARQSYGTNGVLFDLWDMSNYFFKKALLPRTHFISDNVLLVQIQKELRHITGKNWGETQFDARAATVRASLAPQQAILVGRGIAIEKEQMKALCQKVIQEYSKGEVGVGNSLNNLLRSSMFNFWPNKGCEADSVKASPIRTSLADDGPHGLSPGFLESGSNSQRRASISQSQVNLLLCEQYAATEDVMNRYAEDMRVKGMEASEEIFKLVQIEGQSQLIKMMSSIEGLESIINKNEEKVLGLIRHCLPEPAQGLGLQVDRGIVSEKQSHKSEVEQEPPGQDPKQVVGSLSVTVVSARRLPKMDVLSSCDAYCVMFMNEEGHDKCAADYMEYLSQLKTSRVITSRNPVWEQSFRFDVTSMTKSFVLSIWDKDQLTSDDLVGAVEIDIRDLPVDQILDEWFPVRNALAPAKVRNSLVHLKITLKIGAPVSPSSPGPEMSPLGEVSRPAALAASHCFVTACPGSEEEASLSAAGPE